MKLSDLLVPPTKFSKFRCDTYNKFSANPGILYPVWFNLLNPGESASIDLRSVIRTWPVESPLMANMKVRFVTAAFNLKNYAVALEGYKRSFDWRSTSLPYMKYFFNNNASYSYDFSSTDGTTILNPLVNKAYVSCVHDCSLFDYLGYPSGWMPFKTTSTDDSNSDVSVTFKSFLPFLCYYDFYRNYLINPQEENFPFFFGLNEVVEMISPYDEQSTKFVLKPETYVKMLPVSCLDNLIEDVHKYYDGGSSLGSIIDASSNNPFFDYFLFDFYSINTSIGGVSNVCAVPHGGLVATTFDSDINSMWLSVDNYNKLDEVRVNTQSQSGSTYTSFIDIVKASSLWDFMTRSVNSDGTYGDFIGNQFGVSVKGDLNVPQIVHVYDTLLTFDDITSQADTTGVDGAVVGQQFGVGRSFGQSNHFKVVNKDGNYVMLMTFMWVTPSVCYKDGLHHLHNINSFSDLYQPSFDNYAMQPRLQEQVNGIQPASLSIDPNELTFTDASTSPFSINSYGVSPVIGGVSYSGYFSPQDAPLGYQPAWSDYKTDIDVVHGLFRHELDYYTIIRSVPRIDSFNSVASAYIYYVGDSVYASESDAQQYQLPFAIKKEDCLQIQLRVGATITRAMSKNVNPNVK